MTATSPRNLSLRRLRCFVVAAWLFVTLTFQLPLAFHVVAQEPGSAGSGTVESGSHVTGVDFESQIATLLIKRCVECHQPTNRSGSLDLTSAAGLQAGGESGPVVSHDEPEESYLLRRVIDEEMPPPVQGQPQRLSEQEVNLLRRWITAGAVWPEQRRLSLFEQTTDVRAGLDWWSLQPVVRPSVPQPGNMPKPNHPIDAFVLDRLQSAGVTPAPEASRRVLIRRLYVDLIGLAPSEQEIDAFERDESPNAWPRLVDRLLAMPEYGERWARYWLDLARYADTSGYERDQEKAFAWKYRDWVVQALNDDMPYSQFIVHQLAGDEIEDRNEQSTIATGFLRLGTWNDEPNEPLDYQYDRLEDLVHTTSTAFLGMTVKCARCHTHKFDPIAQDDYYRMASVFWAGPIAPRDRELLGGPSAQELGFENVLGWTDLNASPAALQVLKNGEREHPLHEVIPASLSFVPTLERRYQPPSADERTTNRRLQLAHWIADPKNPLTPRVIVNRIWQHHFGQAIVRTPDNLGYLSDPPTHRELLDWLAAEFLHSRGSIKSLHRLILTSQTWRQSSLHPQGSSQTQQDPGNRLLWRAERRRLDAEALRDSLLVAAGCLDSRMGGESFKATVSPEALEGLSQKSSAWQASPAEQQHRRSLYMFLKRGLLPPMMTAFDLCDATQSVGQRVVTIVPTQALALLNNPLVHEQSQFLAKTICARTDIPEQQIQFAWSAILKRPPSVDEQRMALEHLASQQTHFAQRLSGNADPVVPDDGASNDPATDANEIAHPDDCDAHSLSLASLCHVLMNSNEFAYVD